MHLKHCLNGTLAATLFSLTLSAQAGAGFGQNLIANGGAENGATGWAAFDGYSLFQSVDYGDNWVKPSQPGPLDRGGKLFAGVGGQSAGYQLIDLAGLSSAGPITYDLSGWLGGWQSQGDNALLYVSFLDITGHEIGHADIGPVTPADRGNQTGLFFRQSQGVLPVGVSRIMFSLSMERLGGGDNDGYADNLSFVLHATAVPEASALAYALAGLGVMALVGKVARRRA